MKNYEQLKAMVVGLVLSSAVIPVAMADDIEIYVNNSSETSEVNPNILFMVDNSGSMDLTSPVRAYYDPSVSYDGASGNACQRDGIYFVPLGGGKPVCSTSPGNYFNRSALVCDNAKYLYKSDGNKESPTVELGLQLFGTYSDQFARLDDSINNAARWEQLPDTITAAAQRDFIVECLADSGLHGPGTGSSHYMIDETEGGSNGYTSTAPTNLKVPHPVWGNGEGHRTLWDGNYLNYLTDPVVNNPDNFINPTRLQQVQRAVLIMASTNNRVNVGLIALDDNYAANGGGIQYPMKDIVSTRNDFASRVNGLTPDAWTTLSETYYEALLYYGGKDIDYGNGSSPAMNGDAKRGGSLNYKYESPISSTCGANYIVILSDGTPTRDNANTQNAGVDRFDALPGMSKLTCNTEPTFYDPDVDGNDGTKIWDDNLEPDVPSSTIDNCLDELAGWAATEDVATDDADPFHNGMQNIVTHTIGFALDLTDADGVAADTLLKSTAQMGGGKNRLAANGEELVNIFQDFIDTALKVNTTFSSPAVSVNAFNRATHLDDLYFTLFKPHATNNAWLGNLKKYKLKFDDNDVPFIADQTGEDAVNASSGFFDSGAKSYWSAAGDANDGLLVEAGGAAAKLTNARNIYTITGAMADGDSNGVYEPANGILAVGDSNKVTKTNDDLTDALLGITGKQPILDAIPYRETMIDWAAGLDVFNSYGAEDTLGDARLNMGDPLHAEPALVQYGTTTVDGDTVPDLVAFVATNDGYLHAFKSTDGTEIFSFIPQELLTGLPAVMENSGGDKGYGLDGSVVAWVDDVGDDGIITAGTDRVILYFGMRRGGRNIYAVDVTTREEPKLLWAIKGGFGDYAELGQTWSTLNVEKIKDGADDKTVLVFGGGYDATQDNALARRLDGVGRTVFIADAITGEQLWSARDAVTDLDTAMQYSIPARITTADISGDGFTDRLYASDMGGQIFRFDINNTSTRAATLAGSISGARIADLAGAAAEDARRFYYPLDIALVDAAPDGKYHALVTSSGFRAHPLNTEIHDRIYMIKDRNTGLLTSSTQYKYKLGLTASDDNVLGAITESDLKDVTLNLAGGDSTTDADRDAELALIRAKGGWYIDLDNEASPGTWIGEKGLAEPLIIEGVAILTTYTPAEPDTDSCIPPEGSGKVFYLDVVDATPEPPNKTATDTDVRSERHVRLKRGGIPPSPNVIITEKGKAGCVGTECDVVGEGIGIRKTYWYEVEK